MYMEGMTQFLSDLGKELNSDLSAKLTNSTEWKTRIVYPTEFRESELYEVEFVEPKTFYEKFKKWIGMQDNVRVYSTELKKIIKK